MWCRHCQQDMPAVTGGDTGACCMRCGQPLAKPWPEQQIDEGLGLDLIEPADVPAAEIDPTPNTGRPGPAGDPSPLWNDASAPPLAAWDLDEKLREAERLIGLTTARRAADAPAQRPALDGLRIDSAHARVRVPAEAASGGKERTSADARRTFLTWTSICLGLMTFACGGSLLVCAYLQDRGDLWDLGVPMTLAGQVGLLLGLGLQLERLWLENRHTADKLRHVDEQLDALQQTAHLLGGPYYSASENFYQHLSAGASPQLLLSDLKSQLDLLATHMGRRENTREQ